MDPIPIIDGALENICYNTHKNAVNWISLVEGDKSKPGGLNRIFLKKAAHGWAHFSPDIQAGRYLEFAGDRKTMTGVRKEHRQYRKILEVRADKLIVDFCTIAAVGKWEENITPVSIPSPLAELTDQELLKRYQALLHELGRRGLRRPN